MTSRLSALILAAGYSSRMGKLKGLLPLPDNGSETVLKRCVDLFRTCGLEEIIVVSGHARHRIEAAANQYGCATVYNPDFDQGMFSSIQAGVCALPAETEGLFLLPVDIPLIRAGTVAQLLAARQHSSAQVIYPVFNGQRGHPPWVHSSLFTNIKLGTHCQQGLRSLLAHIEQNSPQSVEEVLTCDANILFDMDTPDAYDQACSRARVLGYPTKEECRQLLKHIHPIPEKGLAHGEAVAEAAVCLCREINRNSQTLLDPALCYAAGLLHDIAKGHPEHEATGASWLRVLGFPAAAEIVAAHKDLHFSRTDTLTEKELVHLADKVVRGSQVVSIHQRFSEKTALYKDDPEAVRAIQGRLDQALAIAETVESITDRSLLSILEKPRYSTST
ncbi:MAG: phosphohydrolase [Desulfobulbus propionicus]|nr:MAG: phosphohydrolase [Desulfobulbus propionicus]